ncbi:MAG: Mu transposase C-terminal domain-containing protein, partial [Bacillota bacterium]
ISPLQEWNRDSRELIFIDTRVVGEAFMHHEDRTIDPAGCFSFDGCLYEASTAIAGARVEIAYDPLDTSVITVYYEDMEPIRAKRVTIGPYAQKKPPIPIAMTDAVPATSRFLDALEKRYNEENRMAADAISFGSYRKKEVAGHV